MADQRMVGRRHQPGEVERVGADEERPQVMMDGKGVGLGGAGEDRPRRRLAPPRDAAIGNQFDDDARHGALDVADAVPPLHLERPAHEIDLDAGDAQIAHRVSPPSTWMDWPVM